MFYELKKALKQACYVFCILTLLYSLVMLAVYDTNANMSVFTVLLFYPLSLVFTICNGWLAKKRWNNLAKHLIRYIVLIIDIVLFICLPQAASISSSSGLILFVLITLVYVITSIIIASIKAKVQRKLDKKTEYKNVYNDVNERK